jgi:DNA-binding transcriptional ArsR family regulator
MQLVKRSIKYFGQLSINRNIAINNQVMGATKAEEFSVRDNRLSKFAKALAHPARVAILKILLKRNSCICGDIVEELPLSQSTVSQHLKELKDAGLIKGEIEGVKICYCIDEAEWKKARQNLDELFGAYQPVNSCC